MSTLFLIRHGMTAQTGTILYGRTAGVGLDARGRAQARESHEAGRLSERARGSLDPSCEVRGASGAATIADQAPANNRLWPCDTVPLEPVGGPQDVSRSSLGRH